MIKPYLFAVFEAFDATADGGLAYGDLMRCDLPSTASASRVAAKRGGVVVSQKRLATYQRIQCALFRRSVSPRRTSDTTRLKRLLTRLAAMRETLVLRIACDLPERIIQPWCALNADHTKGQVRLFVATQYLEYLLENPSSAAIGSVTSKSGDKHPA